VNNGIGTNATGKATSYPSIFSIDEKEVGYADGIRIYVRSKVPPPKE
jgi:hypothetical protein